MKDWLPVYNKQDFLRKKRAVAVDATKIASQPEEVTENFG